MTLSGARQLPLDLAPRPAFDREGFLSAPCNEAAFAMVMEAARWPAGRLALIGPEGSGKTHLASIWRQASDAASARAEDLSPETAPRLAGSGAVLVEDFDRFESATDWRRAEDGLFHLYNLLGAEGGQLLLTGRVPPASWTIRTRDLASRLSSVTLARIGAPDDTVLAAVLARHFANRQLAIAEDVIPYLVTRIERSFAAAGRVAGLIDRASLAGGRRITRPFVAAVLSDPAASRVE